MSDMLMCHAWATIAQQQASAGETDSSVPAEEYVRKLKIAADAEIASMTCKWYEDLETKLKKEAEELRAQRMKEQERLIHCRTPNARSTLGPKMTGKVSNERQKKERLKRIEEYSARIRKTTMAAVMASEHKNRVAAASAGSVPRKAPMPSSP